MALKKKSGLGRGLDAIYSDAEYITEKSPLTLKIYEIEPDREQPRKNFENVEELAESIKRVGLISPITVAKNGETYKIVAGERRWRAAKMAGLEEVPVVIVSGDDKKLSEMTLVENIQRNNLNPIELANGYKDMIDSYGLTQEELGEMAGKDRTSISNSLRLLDLPLDVQEMIAKGKLSQGHAKAILALNSKEVIPLVASYVVEKGLSVRETESYVKKQNLPAIKRERKSSSENEEYKKQLERNISQKLGRSIKIVQNGNKSTINIGYTDNEDLEKVIKMLCGEDFIDSI